MLTPKTKQMVERMCAELDPSALREVMQIAKGAYDARLREEIGQWRAGQKVQVVIGGRWLPGTIITTNQKSLTIDLRDGKRIRAVPSSVKLVQP